MAPFICFPLLRDLYLSLRAIAYIFASVFSWLKQAVNPVPANQSWLKAIVNHTDNLSYLIVSPTRHKGRCITNPMLHLRFCDLPKVTQLSDSRSRVIPRQCWKPSLKHSCANLSMRLQQWVQEMCLWTSQTQSRLKGSESVSLRGSLCPTLHLTLPWLCLWICMFVGLTYLPRWA